MQCNTKQNQFILKNLSDKMVCCHRCSERRFLRVKHYMEKDVELTKGCRIGLLFVGNYFAFLKETYVKVKFGYAIRF